MLNAAMNIIVLKEFGVEFPLVLVNNSDNTGFCGFNINLNMAFDREKSYEVFRDELQEKFIAILKFLKENPNIKEHVAEESQNVPEDMEVPVDLIRIEGITFTEDRGEGVLKEAYPDVNEFISNNFNVKEFSYNPCGMTIFYRIELEEPFKMIF